MDEYFLSLAIEEAKKSKDSDGYLIGTVIVKDGKVISIAHSDEAFDNSHAEELAIKRCKESPAGAIIYVTMEPCDLRRSGKKSCCDLIIESGITRVVYGVLDPDTYVPCHGIEKLTEVGLELLHFKSFEDECKKLTHSLPFNKAGSE